MVVKEDSGRVRVLRLAHPPSNVLNLGLLATLRREIEAARVEPSVRCLVLASAYPRYFSSGLDPEELAALPQERRAEPFEALFATVRALLELPKPTVAAVGGSAALGGCLIAMSCDFRLLARETGKLSLAEIRFGLPLPEAVLQRLLSLTSRPGVVKAMVLRGKTLRAEEALGAGLADEATPVAGLDKESLALARQLCRLPPSAYGSVKRGLSRAELDPALWEACARDAARLFSSPEVREGAAALLEKRSPRWEA